MENSTVQTVLSTQKAGALNRYKIILIISLTLFLLLVSFVLALGLGGGGFSYLRRRSNPTPYLTTESQNYDTEAGLSAPQSILNIDLASEDADISMQQVVFAMIQGESFWAWPHNGFLTSFKTTSETGYGIAAAVEENDLRKDRVSTMIEEGTLKLVEIDFQDRTSSLLIEDPPGSLTKQKFQEVIKGGNLVKIFYNKSTRELIDVLLLDFDRI